MTTTLLYFLTALTWASNHPVEVFACYCGVGAAACLIGAVKIFRS